MPTKYEKLALRHAPALHQKIHELNPRGDYITRVDLRETWDDIVHNWEYVNDTGNALGAAGYYSIAETTTHYFILYAFYHAQDWYDGKSLMDKIRKNFDEHLHDMEGALAVVTKRPGNEKAERVDAFITISHYWPSSTESGDPDSQEYVKRCSGRTTRDGMRLSSPPRERSSKPVPPTPHGVGTIWTTVTSAASWRSTRRR